MIATRISDRQLSILCERVGTAFDVGHDPHKIFKREAESVRAAYARRMGEIAKHVEAGKTLADAMESQGNYFPDDFMRMVEVGEKTGRLERVLERLGEYYKDIADARGEFVNSIIWPVIQLLLAVVVVGMLIYVPALVAPNSGEAADMLGIGLVGASGLRTYLIFLAVIGAILGAIYFLFRMGVFSPLKHVFGRMPVIGRLITIFAEARFVQTLSLALESGLDTWHSVELAFNSTSSPIFIAKAAAAKKSVRQGRELHIVLDETALFSKDTIEAIKLGEDAGRLAEILDKQFRYLKAEAKSAMTKFAYLASSFIWVIIASILIFILFRVFSNYLSNIEEAGTAIINRGNNATETSR